MSVNALLQKGLSPFKQQLLSNWFQLSASSDGQDDDALCGVDVINREFSRRSFVAWGVAMGSSWSVLGSEDAHAASKILEAPDKEYLGFRELSVVPFSTTRQYKSIRLANGVQVLLVSDKVVRQASAALTIGGAGQFSDPPGLDGLAHLMEHMALSSRISRRQLTRNKYQDFEDWLEDVDGISNGFTAYEKVCFHYNVPIESFEESLQRFARLFQQEIFMEVCRDEDTLRREIRRVDSELVRSDRFLRELYLTKTLIDKDHPYAKQSAGSIETLERSPNKNGIDVGEKLIQFFKERYLPERAVLVVISPNEISALEAWVASFSTAFSKERKEELSPRAFPRFLPKQNKLYTICLFRKESGNKPGDDLEKLSFQWGLNLDYSGIRDATGRTIVTATQIGFILSQILGRRGPGTLYTLLKRRKWIPEGTLGLPTISFPVDVPGFQILRLELTLTRQGFSSRSSVIAAFYDSINSLQGNSLNPFLLGRELIAEYATVAQLYGYVLAPRPPDAVELAFDAQLYGVAGPSGVGIPSWKLFPSPQDGSGIASIQRTLQDTLKLISEPNNAIIISTASQKTIQFAEKNLLENSFPPLSPASWDISPVTGARYYADNMFRLTGKVNEWLVAKLMEDELSPPRINPLIPPAIRSPRTIDNFGASDSALPIFTDAPSKSLALPSILNRAIGADSSGVEKGEKSDDTNQSSILRDYWTVLRVSSHDTALPTLQLPRAPPEPSCRSLVVLQLLSTRPARANTQMAARAELWKMSLEYAMTDLAELGAPAGLAYEISFNKFGMRVCFLGLSQNIASYARRICRRIVEHQSRLLESSEKLPVSVVEAASRSASRAPRVSPQRKRQILKILKDSSAIDAAVEGIAFFKSCSGGVCFTQGDLLPKEASAILGDLKSIFRKVIGVNVRPNPAVPDVDDIIYRANWIPRSASTCTIAGASLVSNPCGRVPR
jgi:insulysin